MNNNNFKIFCETQFINDTYNIENLLVFCKKKCACLKKQENIEIRI